MRHILLALTAIFAISISTEAQQHRSKISKEHRQELRQYYESQMYPVLKAEHDNFESALSEKDYNFLLAKREEAQALKKEHHNLRKRGKAKMKEGMNGEEVKALFASDYENLKSKRKSLAESIQPFIEKNKELIQQTMETLKPHHQNWKADRKLIHEKYLPSDDSRFQKMEKREKSSEEGKVNKRVKKKAIKFILWDGELKKGEKAPKNDQNVLSDEPFQNAHNLAPNYQILAYPNPAESSTTIAFKLDKEAESVFVKVVDMKGVIRLEIPLENLNPGNHTVQVNLSGLENGNYLYMVEVDGEQDSESIIIK